MSRIPTYQLLSSGNRSIIHTHALFRFIKMIEYDQDYVSAKNKVYLKIEGPCINMALLMLKYRQLYHCQCVSRRKLASISRGCVPTSVRTWTSGVNSCPDAAFHLQLMPMIVAHPVDIVWPCLTHIIHQTRPVFLLNLLYLSVCMCVCAFVLPATKSRLYPRRNANKNMSPLAHFERLWKDNSTR